MVKGITRRVIVVKSPDPRYFEEAIFIVKEDVSLAGVDTDHILREAQTVACNYAKKGEKTRKFPGKIPPWCYLSAGVLLSATIMVMVRFLL